MQWRTKNRSGILWTQSGAADYIFPVIFFFIVSDGSFEVLEWRIVRFLPAPVAYVCERTHGRINIWLHVPEVKDSSKRNIKNH